MRRQVESIQSNFNGKHLEFWELDIIHKRMDADQEKVSFVNRQRPGQPGSKYKGFAHFKSSIIEHTKSLSQNKTKLTQGKCRKQFKLPIEACRSCLQVRHLV